MSATFAAWPAPPSKFIEQSSSTTDVRQSFSIALARSPVAPPSSHHSPRIRTSKIAAITAPDTPDLPRSRQRSRPRGMPPLPMETSKARSRRSTGVKEQVRFSIPHLTTIFTKNWRRQRRTALSYHPLTQLFQRILRPPPLNSVIPQSKNHRTQQRIDEHGCADRVQQEVICGHRRPPGHADVNRKHRRQRNCIGRSRPPVREKHSKKRPQVQKRQPKRRNHRTPPLKRQYYKKILGQIIHHANRTFGPSDGNQISAKHVALREARLLHDFPQLHVVEHFHTKRRIRSHRVINPTPHQVERAHAHVVVGAGISN